MTQSESLENLFNALDGFHKKTNLVKATKENPFFKSKYADYNVVVSETRGDLLENGLRIKQLLTNIEGKTAICTILHHIPSKEFISDISPVVHKDNDAQSQGSGITYAKRYAYVAMLDLLVDADDDGKLASNLTEISEKNEKVQKAIDTFVLASSADELKQLFVATGELMKDKRVIEAKDIRKAELDI